MKHRVSVTTQMTQGKLPKLLKSGYALLLAALVLSCSENGKRVHFIIPQGFRGAFLLQIDPQNGKSWGKSNDEWIVTVPSERLVKLGTGKPFLKWHATVASFENGNNLPYAGNSTAPPNQLQLCHLYTDYNTNHWFYVGTADECRAIILNHSANLTNSTRLNSP